MKRGLALSLLLSLFVGVGFAQQNSAPASTPNQAPPFELDTFYMVLMHRAEHFDPDKFHQVLGDEHAYWQSVADKNELILAGPTDNGKDDLAAVIILRAANADEAAKIAQADPEVSAHLWGAEVHPWVTKKGVLKPLQKFDITTNYYLGLLVRGPKFSPGESPERQKIQEGHMANMKRLADRGKLVAAGPFTEDTDLRGIFVFRTATMEEAQDLTNTDPAVKAGRLAIKLYEWKLPSEAFAKN